MLKLYGGKKIPDFYDLSEDSKNLFIDPLAYTELYLLTIKAGEPKFRYKFVDDCDNVINIGGYGLFCIKEPMDTTTQTPLGCTCVGEECSCAKEWEE